MTEDSGVRSSTQTGANSEGAAAQPGITVIVCTYNRYELLPEALTSLQAQSLPAESIEVLVVDNSSDAAARDTFWGNRPPSGSERLLIETIPGLSRARNIGLREARAPIVAYMDDDAQASPEWCASIVRAFGELADAGIVGGPVEPIWPDGPPPWLHKSLQGFFTIVDHGRRRRTLGDGEWLAGTNIAFRKTALANSGGFNEALGRIGASLLSNEELSAVANIKALGLQAYYEPEARVRHCVHPDRASQQWLRRRIGWQAVSDLVAGTPKLQGDIPWKRLAEYLRPLPPEMRGVRGLFLDIADPNTFNKQCEALEAALYLALNDGRDPESP